MDPDSRRVRVSVTDGRGRPLRAPALARWLTRAAPTGARGEVTVALVPDAHIQKLNRQYRRRNAPTDVLSFAVAEDRAHRAARASTYLGDIVIAKGIARRQAREAGHGYDIELRILALHGLLHLLGYDHHARDDRGRMHRLEARLLRRTGISAGLIDRAHRSVRRQPGRRSRS